MFGCAVMPMCKIARNKYMAEYLPTILKLIELPKLLICCDKEDEDLILGWVCFEPEFQVDEQPILHYVYTAQGVRHNGIASTLLVAAGCLEREFIWTTHYNYRIRRLLKKRKQRWKYNPYLVEVL